MEIGYKMKLKKEYKKGVKKMDKRTLKKIAEIEKSKFFKGQDVSLETCLEEGYLFEYKQKIFQVLKDEQKKEYIVFWTRDIDFDDWMLPALENAEVTVEEFQQFDQLEKAEVISNYFGMIELTGGYYNVVKSIDDFIKSYLV